MLHKDRHNLFDGEFFDPSESPAFEVAQNSIEALDFLSGKVALPDLPVPACYTSTNIRKGGTTAKYVFL